MPETGLLGFSIFEFVKKSSGLRPWTSWVLHAAQLFFSLTETLTGYKEPTFPLWPEPTHGSALASCLNGTSLFCTNPALLS